MSSWQPIETAPMGQWVLAYCPDGFDGFHVDTDTLKPEVRVGLMYGREPGFWEGVADHLGPPTHWMPLPEDPT